MYIATYVHAHVHVHCSCAEEQNSVNRTMNQNEQNPKAAEKPYMSTLVKDT